MTHLLALQASAFSRSATSPQGYGCEHSQYTENAAPCNELLAQGLYCDVPAVVPFCMDGLSST